MEVKIQETGEIKSLDNYSVGVEDFEDVSQNPDWTEDEENEIYIVSQETFDWWDEYLRHFSNDCYVSEQLYGIFGEEAYDPYPGFGEGDFECHHGENVDRFVKIIDTLGNKECITVEQYTIIDGEEGERVIEEFDTAEDALYFFNGINLKQEWHEELMGQDTEQSMEDKVFACELNAVGLTLDYEEYGKGDWKKNGWTKEEWEKRIENQQVEKLRREALKGKDFEVIDREKGRVGYIGQCHAVVVPPAVEGCVVRELWCPDYITTLDVTHVPTLETLGCDNANLTTLDVSQNPALIDLSCSYNNLTTLDVSGASALERLDCSHNQLIIIDLSHTPSLTHLYCDNNHLTTLDLSNNPKLWQLDCSLNNLTTLDTSHNPALINLKCSYNSNLNSLDLSHNPALEYLYCAFTQLTTLDVSHNPELLNESLRVDSSVQVQRK